MKIYNLVLALLLTPFFLHADIVFHGETRSPSQKPTYHCESVHGTTTVTETGDCASFLVALHNGIFPLNTNYNIYPKENDPNEYMMSWTSCKYGDCDTFGTEENGPSPYGFYSNLGSEPQCPNDDEVEYIYSLDLNEDGETDACAIDNPALEQCEQGFHKFKLAGGCVPITCDESGTSSHIWGSGSSYNNTTGTYCDGSCAYSVDGGQNSDNYSGNIALSVVSTGAICGRGGKEDIWHNEGNGEDCTIQGGFVSCPNGFDGTEQTTTPEPTNDLTDEKVALNEITPLIPTQETCTSGDAACEVRNLKESITTKGLEQKEIDEILHNKKIAADEKSSTKIIDGIKDSTGKNLEGLALVTAAIDGLKGEIGGGGSSGDSIGDDVVCDENGDCEGGGVQTDIEPSEGLTGYWVSEYEDGLQGIFDEQLIAVQDTEFYDFIEKFNPSFGAGSAPNFEFCFNIGALGNFGCQSLGLDPRVIPAIKIFILITAGFLCRKILFGG
jgi:hypothetical protein